MEDGRDEEYGDGCKRSIVRHHDLAHVLVDVRVQPVVYHHVPRAKVCLVSRTVPPVL